MRSTNAGIGASHRAAALRRSPPRGSTGLCLLIAWALGLGLALPWTATNAQEPPHILKPDDTLLWSAEPAKGGAAAGWGCMTKVNADGMLELGVYGSVKVAGLTLGQAKVVIDRQITASKASSQASLPEQQGGDAYELKSADVLQWSVNPPPGSNLPSASGKSQVDRDGMVKLGQYGSVKVAGLTYAQAKAAIRQHFAEVVVGSTGAELPNTVQKVSGSRPQLLSCAPTAAASDVLPAAPQVAKAPSSERVSQIAEHDAVLQPATHVPALRSSVFGPDYLQSPSQSPEDSTKVAVLAPIPPPDTTVPSAPRRVPIREPIEPTAPQASWPGRPGTSAAPVPLPAEGLGSCPGHTPRRLNMSTLGAYIIAPPDVLLVESTQSLRDQPIRGQHLVRPDGTIGLGIYGSVAVAGLTLEQAQAAVAAQIATRVKNLDTQNLYVDVLAYNSKVYYVITDGGGYGEQVYRYPITGSETVLDAISQIAGLPAVASKKHIWLARPIPGDCYHQQVLPVDWPAVSQCAMTATNYQLLPGDRVYVKADGWITFDSRVAKVLSPFTRMLGFTLLGAETVQTIRNKNGNNGGF